MKFHTTLLLLILPNAILHGQHMLWCGFTASRLVEVAARVCSRSPQNAAPKKARFKDVHSSGSDGDADMAGSDDSCCARFPTSFSRSSVQVGMARSGHLKCITPLILLRLYHLSQQQLNFRHLRQVGQRPDALLLSRLQCSPPLHHLYISGCCGEVCSDRLLTFLMVG